MVSTSNSFQALRSQHTKGLCATPPKASRASYNACGKRVRELPITFRQAHDGIKVLDCSPCMAEITSAVVNIIISPVSFKIAGLTNVPSTLAVASGQSVCNHDWEVIQIQALSDRQA